LRGKTSYCKTTDYTAALITNRKDTDGDFDHSDKNNKNLVLSLAFLSMIIVKIYYVCKYSQKRNEEEKNQQQQQIL